LTRLKEARAEIHASRDTLQLLLNDHQALVRQIREDIDAVGKAGDVGTDDFLTGVLESHEKMAWMLRSYLR
ncbi:ferritin-like domain-containing protein, partial [Acinetobacter baumannii]